MGTRLGEKTNSKEVAVMYYTGIDLHKKTSYLTTVDGMGKIVKKANLSNDENAVLFMELDGEARIVIESMCSWYWLYDLLIANGFDVVISNPVKTKAIA
jgi:transposase